MIYKSLLRPLLFRLEAEKAHNTTLNFAKIATNSFLLRTLARWIYNYQSQKLSRNIWGLNFHNPVGLAAGFDKNGQFPEIMEAIGLGFVEIGSITAKPSTGNPKPRMFRLPDDHSLINRLGLNNDGAKTVIKRLKNKNLNIPIGINIAKSNDPTLTGDQAIEDYLISYREAQKIGNYITINISCPNTADGRTFEDPGALNDLLSALNLKSDARATATLVKFSADLNRDHLEQLIQVCEDHRVHGYVAANTSSGREALSTDPRQLEEIGGGGLSGRAIAGRSTQIIRWIRSMIKGQKPIIGVGGIDSAEQAMEKLKAGADLLQVYTGFVYEGPGLVKNINKGIVRYLNRHGLDSIHQVRQESISLKS
ncbi:MAG: quinone-dependent dihydroorotate dehydrogenase [Balneolaceae bacterium]|nr:quinone-dependent dihydroorotate dehydrogenase [Balneolaceae bacterium]